jgi:para-aminobenzoate synthetase component 1
VTLSTIAHLEAHPLSLPPDPTLLLQRLPQEKGCFLLESGGGPADISRYSFLGFRPFMTFSCFGRHYSVVRGETIEEGDEDPLDVMDCLLQTYRMPLEPSLPPFVGGAVGYWGYDLGRLYEPIPSQTTDDLNLPDICLSFYDNVVVIDHEKGTVTLYTSILADDPTSSKARARELVTYLVNERTADPPEATPIGDGGQTSVTSNFSRDEYLKVIQSAIDYIFAGDIFQVNMAQRFAAGLPYSSRELWTRLRAINPAPFSAYLDYGYFQVVSASPERFLQVVPESLDPLRWKVETRPIKGTRRRGKTAEQDEAMRASLAGSLKDRAELNMIVDLERNDIGRVCEFGTVRVPDARRIEAYPTVFHTVATVEGALRPGVTMGELLRASFPGGSITGAPKVRAMQIIEELETVRRAIYTGSIGYIGFNGVTDLNIVIRTFIAKDGRVYFHAGGGIVADSKPADEYEETITKAMALMRALGVSDVETVQKGS